MKQIKIKKELWDAIVSGEKKYEFRKLSKGLVSGTYRFLDIELMEDDGVTFYVGTTDLCDSEGYPVDVFPYVLGTAKLKVKAINPKLWENNNCYWVDHEYHQIDHESFDFVRENYIFKHVEFIVYVITEVKNETN